MTTLTKDNIGVDWIDIVTELSLDTNVSYIVQNVSPYPLEIKEKTTTPTSTEYGQALVPNSPWVVTINAATGIYIRNQKEDDNKLGRLAVTKSTSIAGPYVNSIGSNGDFPLYIQDVDYNNRSSLNTVFGEKVIGIRKADIAAQFQYGFPANAASTEVENGGTITIVESMLTLSTGTNTAGSAAISNRKALRYIPGQEAFANFTTVFATPKVDSYQRAGLFDNSNGFFIGYEGTDFCVTRRRASVDTKHIIDLSGVFSSHDGIFDPTKGNVYRISFGYLGFDCINFEVMSPCGCWRQIYRIEYPNSSTDTHITNTNLQPRSEVVNTGNNTDIILKVGSFSAGVIDGGGVDPAARRFTFAQSDQSISAGELMVVTFRSKSSFASSINYIQSVFTLLSFNTDLSKSSLWELEKNATITGTPTWTDVNTLDSTIEYSTDVVVSRGTGDLNFSIPLGRVDRELITNLEEQNIELLPNDYMTLFIVSPNGTTGTYDLAFRWKELF